MKKKLSLFLTALLLAGNILSVTAHAEDVQNTEASNPTAATEASTPVESALAVPPESKLETSTEPTEDSTGNTTVPTENQTPKPCSHTYGDWNADEGSHWRICTLCSHQESAGHSWASETITVAPTCKDPGGVCKICTVCQGILVTQIIPQTAEHTYDNDCDDSCNVCGTEREVSHTYGSGWTYSYKGHWHKCTECGAAGELKSHYPGPAATEEKNQICLTCGYVMTQKLEHTHKYSSDWSNDDSGHWHVCTGCQEKDKFAVHAYDNICDTDCNDCGYTREVLHEYGAWLSDETAHWQVCALCNVEGNREPHGGGADSCGICLYEVAEVHEHEYAPEWKFDESLHWQECDCGQKGEEAEHVWNEGREEDDMIIYICGICQTEKQEALEKGFPWLLFLAGGGIILCAAGIVACISIGRKKGSFSR